MAQFGFFDADKRLSALSAKGDPLVGITRTIGIVRAKIKIGLQNPAYNIRRLVVLELAAAA